MEPKKSKKIVFQMMAIADLKKSLLQIEEEAEQKIYAFEDPREYTLNTAIIDMTKLLRNALKLRKEVLKIHLKKHYKAEAKEKKVHETRIYHV